MTERSERDKLADAIFDVLAVDMGISLDERKKRLDAWCAKMTTGILRNKIADARDYAIMKHLRESRAARTAHGRMIDRASFGMSPADRHELTAWVYHRRLDRAASWREFLGSHQLDIPSAGKSRLDRALPVLSVFGIGYLLWMLAVWVLHKAGVL